MTPHRRQLLQDAVQRHRALAERERKVASTGNHVVAKAAQRRADLHDKQAEVLQAELDAAS